MEEAARLLGRPHEVVGQVVSGDGRGTGLGYPTANIESETSLVPGDGVYAVSVLGLGDTSHGGVCNIGMRPTVGEGPRQVEVHLLDESGDYYGEGEVVFSSAARENAIRIIRCADRPDCHGC